MQEDKDVFLMRSNVASKYLFVMVMLNIHVRCCNAGTSDDKTIVDMQDIKSYLKFKFKKTLKKCNFDKLSLEVLKAVVR